MSIHDLHYLMPYISLSLGGLIVLMLGIIPWAMRLNLPFWASVCTLLFTANRAWYLIPNDRVIEGIVHISPLSQSAAFFFSLVTLAVVILSRGYPTLRKQYNEIYYALLLFSLCGMMLIPAANNLIVFFIGIELMAISHFCLIAFKPYDAGGIEAATKYLITAGVSAAFMMLGISFIYAGSGTLDITAIVQALSYPKAQSLLVLMGFAMLLVVVAFELAVVPLHCWLADVYQGAPMPIVAFIGTIGKLALISYCLVLSTHLEMIWRMLQPIILILALLSMVVGTLLALKQNNVKRLLAYSSVAHFGYLLVPFAIAEPAYFSSNVIVYYAISYTFMSFALLGCMSLVGDRQPWLLDRIQGLGRAHPSLGFIMTLALLSLAGIPPLAGFFGKFMIFYVAFNHHAIAVMVIMALTSAAALYYYLRVILALYSASSAKQGQSYVANNSVSETDVSLSYIHKTASAMPVIAIALLIAMGFFVQPVMHWAAYITQ